MSVLNVTNRVGCLAVKLDKDYDKQIKSDKHSRAGADISFPSDLQSVMSIQTRHTHDEHTHTLTYLYCLLLNL